MQTIELNAVRIMIAPLPSSPLLVKAQWHLTPLHTVLGIPTPGKTRHCQELDGDQPDSGISQLTG